MEKQRKHSLLLAKRWAFGSGEDFLFELQKHSAFFDWLQWGQLNHLGIFQKKCSVLGVGMFHSWPFSGTSGGVHGILLLMSNYHNGPLGSGQGWLPWQAVSQWRQGWPAINYYSRYGPWPFPSFLPFLLHAMPHAFWLPFNLHFDLYFDILHCFDLISHP